MSFWGGLSYVQSVKSVVLKALLFAVCFSCDAIDRATNRNGHTMQTGVCSVM